MEEWKNHTTRHGKACNEYRLFDSQSSRSGAQPLGGDTAIKSRSSWKRDSTGNESSVARVKGEPTRRRY